jgi:hypothetical protein
MKIKLFRNPEEGQGSQRAVVAVMMMTMIFQIFINVKGGATLLIYLKKFYFTLIVSVTVMYNYNKLLYCYC